MTTKQRKGYWFRSGRGWYTKVKGKFIPLEDASGNRLKSEDTPVNVLKSAYHREHANKPLAPSEAPETITVKEVCDLFLEHLKQGRKSTYEIRGSALFDFCTGWPKDQWQREKRSGRIHDGHGELPVCEVTKPMVTAWIQAHATYGPGTKRILVQSLKRAFNWAAAEERGIISKNPIKGWKLAEVKAQTRVTYINDAQEQALMAAAKLPLRKALVVLLKTGLRPSEFCNLKASQISDDGTKLRIRLGTETKTKKGRIVPVNNELAKQYIREGVAKHPNGPIFRNSRHDAWQRPSLTDAFKNAKRRAEKTGIEFDPPNAKEHETVVLYSCRHSYGKRLAGGHGGNQPATIETICRLMGNTPDVARKYLEDNDAGTLTADMLDRFAPS